MKPANDYPKRILLAVCGMSPQIVTETLYSLAIKQAQPFIPTEIHIITTLSGAEEARLLLLHPNTGKFHQFCQDYQLQAIDFSESHIHVIHDDQGVQLNDIKTPAQNEAAADFITEKLREFSRDEQTALHVSIAGGRKTMGYYIGYALSLYGRAQDQLSHVLVTDRYENLRGFFYPTPYSQVIEDRNGLSLDSKNAEVLLATIPFVRLRSGMPTHLLEGKTSFNESIKFARQLESPPHLQIDKAQRCFWVAETIIKMDELDFVFYLWLLEYSLQGKMVTRLPADNNQEYAEAFLQHYRQYFNDMKRNERTEKALEKGMSNQWISDRLGKIKKQFESSLNTTFANPYIIKSIGKNNNRQYYIDLTEEQITYL